MRQTTFNLSHGILKTIGLLKKTVSLIEISQAQFIKAKLKDDNGPAKLEVVSQRDRLTNFVYREYMPKMITNGNRINT